MRLYKSGILTAISLALMAQVNCQASEPLPIAKSATAQSEQNSTLAPWEQLMEKATEAHNKINLTQRSVCQTGTKDFARWRQT
ncbi:MAG: hypothetical protein IPP57_01775 [Candidatus Obscuribacter sp.]|nr:hypothetical protein [Candidatus Obscuribacter sp.]